MKCANWLVVLTLFSAGAAHAEISGLNCFVTDGADLGGTKYTPMPHAGDFYPNIAKLSTTITNPEATVFIPVDGGIDLYAGEDFTGQASTLVNSGTTEMKIALKDIPNHLPAIASVRCRSAGTPPPARTQMRFRAPAFYNDQIFLWSSCCAHADSATAKLTSNTGRYLLSLTYTAFPGFRRKADVDLQSGEITITYIDGVPQHVADNTVISATPESNYLVFLGAKAEVRYILKRMLKGEHSPLSLSAPITELAAVSINFEDEQL